MDRRQSCLTTTANQTFQRKKEFLFVLIYNQMFKIHTQVISGLDSQFLDPTGLDYFNIISESSLSTAPIMSHVPNEKETVPRFEVH